MSFRDDREAMRTRIEELEAELDRARRRIEELEAGGAELERLRARVAELEAELETPKQKAKRERESKERESKERESKERESKERESKERESKERASREKEAARSKASSEGETDWRALVTPTRAVFGLLGVALVSVLGYTQCAPPTWSGGQPPTIGVIDLARTPTPPSIQGMAEGGRATPMGCAGVVPLAPQLVVRTTSRQSVSFHVESASDTVLLVQSSGGEVFCDDDSGGGLAPALTAVLEPGEHRVWVGLYESSDTAPFSMTIASLAAPEGEIDGRGLSPSSTPTLGRIALTDGVEERSGSVVPQVSASAIDDRCRGYLPIAPTAALLLDEASYVRLDARASEDLVLFVESPGGTIHCDDDSGAGNAPRIAERLERGTHLVWVGRYGESELSVSFSLGVRGAPVSRASRDREAMPLREGQTVRITGSPALVRDPACGTFVAATPDAVLTLETNLDVSLAELGTALVVRGPTGPRCLAPGGSTWVAGRHEVFVAMDPEAPVEQTEITLTASAPSIVPYEPAHE
jgi:hypothetical protein